jgi:signal transduction histidine kinase
MSGLRGALVGLALAGIAFGLVMLVLILTIGQGDVTGPFLVLALTLGWAFIAAGLYAWWRRPNQPVGQLMTLVGYLWFVSGLSDLDSTVPFTIGNVLGGLWAGALIQLLAVFPAGRAKPGLERAVVIGGWVTAVVQPLGLLLTPTPINDCKHCPENLLLVSDSPTAFEVFQAVVGTIVVAVLAGLAVVLVRRWRRAGPVQRRALAPVLWVSAGIAVVGVGSAVPGVLGADDVTQGFDYVLISLITLVPFAFLLGLLRSNLGRAEAVSALVERVGEVSVRDTLAQALGDPTLELVYWLPEPGRYVDADGHHYELPDGRAVTEIEHDGALIAAMVHDPGLLEDPALVRAAGAAAGLAVRNERLDAELRARYEELRASRARLVAAGDAARRRIERDLHDGAQQHLVSLALTLRLARLATEDGTQAAKLLDGAIEQLKQGLHELRELARGIHPAVLTERGLNAAVEGLAARAPVPVTVSAQLDERLPPAVESAAYFVIAEALTNVAKYAHASAAEVSVRREDGHVVIDVSDDGIGGADAAQGSGLRGIADRVAALDGRVRLDSPPGKGTLVRAELPA